MKHFTLEVLYRRQLSNLYQVKKKLGDGGYGITFLAKELFDKRREVVVKLPNLDLQRDREDLKSRLEEFNRSLDSEYEGMRRLRGVQCVAQVLGTSGCELNLGGNCLRVPFIIQQYVRGSDFDNYLLSPPFRKHIRTRPTPQGKASSPFGGIENPGIFFDLSSKIVKALAEVHRHEVVHGDLWPQNILINQNHEPIIIDFGQSLLIDLVFLAQTTPISHNYAAPERREPRGQWSTAADIYSLGGILFFMATGDPPPEPIEDRENLKIEICNRIRKANPALYLANSGIADVIARCLRHSDRDRPSFAEGVLEELSIFLTDSNRRTISLSKSVDVLRKSVTKLERGPSEIFSRIAAARINTLTRQFSEMSDGLYTLSGHNENIIRGMVDSLSLLTRGDSYLTVSVSSFWNPNPNGLGTNGRFLEMNKIAAQNGIRIGRVFLLTEDEIRSDTVRKILKAHLRVIEELGARSPSVSTLKWSSNPSRGGYYVGIKLLDDNLRDELDITNFGILTKTKRNQDVLIVPQYREKDRDVAAIRFWAPIVAAKRIDALKKQAIELIEKSTPLVDFISALDRPIIDKRKAPRSLQDERIPVGVLLMHKPGPGVPHIKQLNASVTDRSRSGLGLRITTPLQIAGLAARGTRVLLSTPCPFSEPWARRFWGNELRVQWTSDPRHVPWKLGLKTAS